MKTKTEMMMKMKAGIEALKPVVLKSKSRFKDVMKRTVVTPILTLVLGILLGVLTTPSDTAAVTVDERVMSYDECIAFLNAVEKTYGSEGIYEDLTGVDIVATPKPVYTEEEIALITEARDKERTTRAIVLNSASYMSGYIGGAVAKLCITLLPL